jgi:hypothetical protein
MKMYLEICYEIRDGDILSFGTILSPVTFSAQNLLMSELLRTL